MVNLPFSKQDIEGLAQKVSTLELSEQERALLMAIFGAAAEHASSSEPGQATLPRAVSSGQMPEAGAGGQETIASLQQQLLSAYIPGNSFDSLTSDGGPPETGRVGETHKA
jgi:hypothetical protein